MKKFILILYVFLSMNAFSGQERGGGTEVEREFVKMGRLAADAITYNLQRSNHVFDGFNITAFTKAIDEIEVYGLQKVCEGQEGRCLDARYLPEKKRIEFDMNIWNTKTCMQMVSIAVHEYGRASGNEDGNYKYSSRMDQADINRTCEELDRERRVTHRATARLKYGIYKVYLHSPDSDSWHDIEIEPGMNAGQATVSFIGASSTFIGINFDCSDVKCIGNSPKYYDSNRTECVSSFELRFLMDGNMVVQVTSYCGNSDFTGVAKYKFDHAPSEH